MTVFVWGINQSGQHWWRWGIRPFNYTVLNCTSFYTIILIRDFICFYAKDFFSWNTSTYKPICLSLIQPVAPPIMNQPPPINHHGMIMPPWQWDPPMAQRTSIHRNSPPQPCNKSTYDICRISFQPRKWQRYNMEPANQSSGCNSRYHMDEAHVLQGRDIFWAWW